MVEDGAVERRQDRGAQRRMDLVRAEVAVSRQSGGVGEDVAGRQPRAVGGRIDERAEGRQVGRGGAVEVEAALVAQAQGGQRGEGLGDRADAEDGVALDRFVALDAGDRQADVEDLDTPVRVRKTIVATEPRDSPAHSTQRTKLR